VLWGGPLWAHSLGRPTDLPRRSVPPQPQPPPPPLSCFGGRGAHGYPPGRFLNKHQLRCVAMRFAMGESGEGAGLLQQQPPGLAGSREGRAPPGRVVVDTRRLLRWVGRLAEEEEEEEDHDDDGVYAGSYYSGRAGRAVPQERWRKGRSTGRTEIRRRWYGGGTQQPPPPRRVGSQAGVATDVRFIGAPRGPALGGKQGRPSRAGHNNCRRVPPQGTGGAPQEPRAA
jgi:hypothetical protein